MRLRFAANLNWLFKECENFAERYAAAAKAGFKAVESADPYHLSLESLVEAKSTAGVEHVLMNAWPGEISKGELGISAIPGRQAAFRESLQTSITYCKALNCSRLHIMAGRKSSEHSVDEMRKVYIDNLKYACEQLSRHDITALIEPINTKISVPNYFLDNADEAVRIIEEVQHPNLKLQMDFFHIQLMHGDLTSNIKRLLPYVGHIQIAQVPDRHEPDSAGEVNYTYIFDMLEQQGYKGFIGLEYNPAGSTVDGLAWLRAYNG